MACDLTLIIDASFQEYIKPHNMKLAYHIRIIITILLTCLWHLLTSSRGPFWIGMGPSCSFFCRITCINDSICYKFVWNNFSITSSMIIWYIQKTFHIIVAQKRSFCLKSIICLLFALLYRENLRLFDAIGFTRIFSRQKSSSFSYFMSIGYVYIALGFKTKTHRLYKNTRSLSFIGSAHLHAWLCNESPLFILVQNCLSQKCYSIQLCKPMDNSWL